MVAEGTMRSQINQIDKMRLIPHGTKVRYRLSVTGAILSQPWNQEGKIRARINQEKSSPSSVSRKSSLK